MSIFSYAESVPSDFPGTTITGKTVGPVVFATHKVANVQRALVALNHVEFWECVKTGLGLLNDVERAELTVLAGGVTDAEHQAALDALADAEAAVESARGDVHVVADRIAERIAEVIDLGAERAKRRPETVGAA